MVEQVGKRSGHEAAVPPQSYGDRRRHTDIVCRRRALASSRVVFNQVVFDQVEVNQVVISRAAP